MRKLAAADPAARTAELLKLAKRMGVKTELGPAPTFTPAELRALDAARPPPLATETMEELRAFMAARRDQREVETALGANGTADPHATASGAAARTGGLGFEVVDVASSAIKLPREMGVNFSHEPIAPETISLAPGILSLIDVAKSPLKSE